MGKMKRKWTMLFGSIFLVTVLITFQNCGATSTGGFGIGTAASTSPISSFYFSGNGAIPNMFCAQITQTADPDWGRNNFICTTTDVGIQWSTSGAINGAYCLAIDNPAEPSTYNWANSFLCTNQNMNLAISYSGPITGDTCTSLANSDPTQWWDAYLCYP